MHSNAEGNAGVICAEGKGRGHVFVPAQWRQSPITLRVAISSLYNQHWRQTPVPPLQSAPGLTLSPLCFLQGHPKGRCVCSYMDGVAVVCISLSWVRLDPKLERMPAQTVVGPLTLFSLLVLSGQPSSWRKEAFFLHHCLLE